MSRTPHRTFAARPPGFTLVEIMVALVVFCLGLTLLAGVAARSIRLVHRGRIQLAEAVILTDRLERFRIALVEAGCSGGRAGGGTLPGGRREAWVVTPRDGIAVLTDSLLPPAAESGAATVLGAAVPCP
jgi:prepilin-type N-terminal cleavage/methylation domain-containing protein